MGRPLRGKSVINETSKPNSTLQLSRRKLLDDQYISKGGTRRTSAAPDEMRVLSLLMAVMAVLLAVVGTADAFKRPRPWWFGKGRRGRLGSRPRSRSDCVNTGLSVSC
ncbi:hypothetical protein Hamer_G006655 [Homarus americanus]|uniref:Uncharacterized protein n=1 Tax=Homarus americanus TaxID=6706 RepID=A0A8J5MMJ5_HOMAM|nr:hypothetical protein Hamer_G006655 [Homarus americanus]